MHGGMDRGGEGGREGGRKRGLTGGREELKAGREGGKPGNQLVLDKMDMKHASGRLTK